MIVVGPRIEQDLQGFSITIEIAQLESWQNGNNGWFFGSGATRSRGEVTEVGVRAGCCDVVAVVGGGWGTGARSFNTGGDAEYCAERGDAGSGAAGAIVG